MSSGGFRCLVFEAEAAGVFVRVNIRAAPTTVPTVEKLWRTCSVCIPCVEVSSTGRGESLRAVFVLVTHSSVYFARCWLHRTVALRLERTTPCPPRCGDFISRRPPCCLQYVLRVVYRERAQETTHPVGVTPSVMPETREREPKGSGGAPCAAAVPKGGDQGATDLLALVTAAKGLLQRTRVLSKRLNSLCAIHPQLMWELEEARRLRPEAEGGARIQEVVEFPDPFELGTLEVIALIGVHVVPCHVLAMSNTLHIIVCAGCLRIPCYYTRRVASVFSITVREKCGFQTST